MRNALVRVRGRSSFEFVPRNKDEKLIFRDTGSCRRGKTSVSSNSPKTDLDVPIFVRISGHNSREQARTCGPRSVGECKQSAVLLTLAFPSFPQLKISLRSSVLRSDLSFTRGADTRVHFAFPRKDRPTHRRTAFPRRGYYASGIVMPVT